jgi:hypothetical protein
MVRSNVEARDGKASAARLAGRGEWVEESKQVVLGGDKGGIMSRKEVDQAQMRRCGVKPRGERLGQKWAQSP